MKARVVDYLEEMFVVCFRMARPLSFLVDDVVDEQTVLVMVNNQAQVLRISHQRNPSFATAVNAMQQDSEFVIADKFVDYD